MILLPNRKSIRQTPVILVLLLMLPACRNMAPDSSDSLSGYVPSGFDGSTNSASGYRNTKWWKEFGSIQLDQLMERAFRGSLTLEQAAARVQQFEAIARRSGAAVWPSLTARADGSTR